MADYSIIKSLIQQVVKTNGEQEITGANLQNVLVSMINAVASSNNEDFDRINGNILNLLNYVDTENEDIRNEMQELANRLDTNRFGYNVSVFGLVAGVHTLSTAVKNVPPAERFGGQKITFKTDAGWVTYQNTSLSIDNYEDVNNWVLDSGVNVEGDVTITNNPDYEDLTQNSQNELKFADKEYNADTFSGLGRVYLRKNIVSYKNVLTQAMLADANTIYIIQYDYDLNGTTITIPANCVLKFEGGSISKGTLVLQDTLFDGIVYFGADMEFSGNCANQSAYQNWFDGNDIDAWHKFINKTDGVVNYEYETGTYEPLIYLYKEVDEGGLINIHGNNSILNFKYISGETAISILPKNVNIYTSSTITSEANKGDITITVFDGSLFSEGDNICIIDTTDYSFSFWRPYYRQTEFAVISNINGNTITLANPLMGVYKHISNDMCQVYKFNSMTCNVSDLSIDVVDKENVSAEFFGIHIRQSIGGSLKNVCANNYKTALYIDQTQNFTIDNCIAIVNNIQSSSFDSYALQISNCQTCNVIGGNYVGGNHGISIGGAYNELSVISRNILVSGVHANQIKNDFRVSIDMHGNAEYVTIESCVTKGIICRGRNNNIINNYVYENSIEIGEVLSYNMNIKGNTVRSGTILMNVSPCVTQSGWVNDNVESVYLCQDNKVNYEGEPLYVYGYIPPTHPNYDKTKVIIKGNYFFGLMPLSNAKVLIWDSNVVYMYGDSDNYTSRFSMIGEQVVLDGNTFNGIVPTNRMFNFVGTDTVTIKNNSVNVVGDLIHIANDENPANIIIVNNNITSGRLIYLGRDNSNIVKTINANGNICHEDGASIIYNYTGKTDTSIRINVKNNVINKETDINIVGYARFLYYSGNQCGSSIGKPYFVAANMGEIWSDDESIVTTSERDGMYYGKGVHIYDKTINKSIVSAYKKLTLAFHKQINNNSGDVFSPNTLTEGTIYNFTISRTTNNTVAFSKVDSNPSDSDLLIVLTNGLYDNIYIAPSASTYPYILTSVSSGSWTDIDAYTVTKYVEADGATAGVSRNGTTENRPVGNGIFIGFQYFDTTLGKPIYAKAISGDTVTWVDATGATV